MQWVAETGWIEMLAKDSNTISNTFTYCLQIYEKFADLQESEQRDFIKDVVGLLASEDVAHDIEGVEIPLIGFFIMGEGCGVHGYYYLYGIEWAYSNVKSDYRK